MLDPQRTNKIRDQVVAWSATHHRAVLTAGIQSYLGRMEREPQAVMNAAAYAIVAPPEEGDSLIERYERAHPPQSRFDRDLFGQWTRSRFALLRFVDVEEDVGFHVHDPIADRRFFVHERSLTRQLGPGEWVAGFLATAGDRTEFEGGLWPIPTTARHAAVKAAIAVYRKLGIDVRTASAKESRRAALPALVAAQAVLLPPRFVTSEGDDVELITATLDIEWKVVKRAARAWSHVRELDVGFDVVTAEPLAALGGPVVCATFRPTDAGTTVFTNSRPRMEAALARLATSMKRQITPVSEQVTAVPSNPKGPPIMVDAASILTSAPDADSAQREYLASTRLAWPDTVIPALDGVSPREALAAGRTAEVWALLPDDEFGDQIAGGLGLEPTGG